MQARGDILLYTQTLERSVCLESINQSLVVQPSEVLFLQDLSLGTVKILSVSKVLAQGKD